MSMSEEEIRREVRDKLTVYAIADRNTIPLQKAIVQRQCEDFLVELFTASARPEVAAPLESERKAAIAMWAFVDHLKAKGEPFAVWPDALKAEPQEPT